MKNIEKAKIIELKKEVEILKGQVISKTLSQNDAVNVTLFGFDKGEEISTHQSEGDAMVTILEGVSEITIDNNKFVLKEGETIIMPAKKPHSLLAIEPFKMMLTVIF